MCDFKRLGEGWFLVNYSSRFFLFLVPQETNCPTGLPFKEVTDWHLEKWGGGGLKERERDLVW